jgi:hypothetical protein
MTQSPVPTYTNAGKDQDELNNDLVANRNYIRDKANPEQKTLWLKQRAALYIEQNFVKQRNILEQKIDSLTNNIETERLSQLDELAKQDLFNVNKLLKNDKYILDKLYLQLPVNFIVDGDIVLGFNATGLLVAVFDNYDNQVAIVYDKPISNQDLRIEKVVGLGQQVISFEYDKVSGKLNAIVSVDEKRTEFVYDHNINGNLLTKLVYPNGEMIEFAYKDANYNNIMTKIIPPSQVCTEIWWNDSKVSKLYNIIEGEIILERSSTSFSYVQSEHKSTITNKAKSTQIIFDTDGRIIKESTFVKGDLRSNVEIEFLQSGDKWVTTSKDNDGGSVYTEYEDELCVKPVFERVIKYFDKTEKGQSVEKLTRQTEIVFEYRDDKLVNQVSVVVVKSSTDIQLSKKEASQTFEYNKQGQLIRTIEFPSKIVNENIFDDNGNLIKSQSYHLDYPAQKLISQQEVDDNGQVVSEMDELGNKTKMSYINGTNVVSEQKTSHGQKIAYGFDSHGDVLKHISSSVEGQTNETIYKYKNEQLRELSSGNTKIGYEYDGFGRLSAIGVDDINYLTNSYTEEDIYSQNGMKTIVRTLYNNTTKEGYEYIYNAVNNIKEIWYLKDNQRVLYVSNEYDAKDRLIKTIKHITEETIEYAYDNNDRLYEQKSNLNITNEFDMDGNVIKTFIKTYMLEQKYEYKYTEENKISEIKLPSGLVETFATDRLQRVSKLNTATGSKEIN